MIEIHFFATVDHNRDFQNFEPKLEMLIEIDFFRKCEIFEILKRNQNFCRKYLSKSRFSKFWTKMENFFENVDWNQDFPNFEPKANFFRKCWPKFEPKSIFFENVDRIRDFWNFEPKAISFFRKCWPKSRFFKILNQNLFFFQICWHKSRFSKFWTEIEISCEIFDWNQDFPNFEPNSSKFFENAAGNRDFRNFESKSKFFRKCWPQMRFLKFWTEIEFFSKMLIENESFEILRRDWIFFESVDQNRDFRNFDPKLKLFWKYWPKPRYPKFWTDIEFFSKILTEIEVFEILHRNRNLFENVDRSRDFLNFEPKFISYAHLLCIYIFYPKCWPKSRFSIFWSEIETFSKMLIFKILNRNRFFFRKYWPKSRYSKFWSKFFVNVDWNRDHRNFEPKIEFCSKM